MFAILPDIWSVMSRKVVLVVCGRKIKNSWLNPFFLFFFFYFFIKVQNYPMQKYWIHQFNILLCSLCFVSLLPVTFYSWPQIFHTDPALLYPILPCINPLIISYCVDSAYELLTFKVFHKFSIGFKSGD